MPGPVDGATGPSFSGITTGNGPAAGSAMSSYIASLSSEFIATTGTASAGASTGLASTATTESGSTTTTAATALSSSLSSSTDAASSSTTPAASSSTPTTLATVSTTLGSGSATISQTPSGTATNAASNTSGVAVTKEEACSGISCSSGLQAAVAVPVVVAALGFLALLIFCARRRRRRGAAPVSEKKQTTGRKRWTRHLRAFSFDAELLMGGRFSSNGSTRSRDGNSLHSGQTSVRSAQPSLHSVEEEVAPPYRDAISHTHSPSMTNAAAGLGAGAAAIASTVPSQDPIPRPASAATAPPPYVSIAGNLVRSPQTPTSSRNPFSDSQPVTPTEASPFNDPPSDDEAGARTGVSRGSSLYHSVRGDDVSMVSDAASIRQAQLGRNLSVMSGGRTIENVRGSS